jgi:hypothetical protein
MTREDDDSVLEGIRRKLAKLAADLDAARAAQKAVRREVGRSRERTDDEKNGPVTPDQKGARTKEGIERGHSEARRKKGRH